MANTQDIRRRIKSVSNTAQITNAMQLVAASKMKKAQEFATSGRPFAEVLNRVLVNLKANTEDETHPLLEDREKGKTLLVLITTDKGLCGGLNTNLIRKVLDAGDEQTDYVTIGRKGRQALARSKKNLIADFNVSDPAEFSEAKLVAKFVMDKFLEGEYRRVKVAFTNFVSTLTQKPTIETLLPIREIELGRDKDFVSLGGSSDPVKASDVEVVQGEYIFEPNATEVLDSVVPYYVDFVVFQMMQESRASEHSARMVAMKSATDNAQEMIKDLKLEYNKIRQAAITTELLDITTAMKALD